MGRIGRAILTVLTVASALTCAAVCGAWMRSECRVDLVEARRVRVESARGILLVCSAEPAYGQPSLPKPADWNTSGDTTVMDLYGGQLSYMLSGRMGFGITRPPLWLFLPGLHVWAARNSGWGIMVRPVWGVAATALLPLGRLAIRVRPYHRWITGRCRRCGYDLRASAGRCPECGAAAGTG